MKRFILKFIAFTIILIVFNILYLEYLKEHNIEFSKAIFISQMEGENFECIVLGNSVALDGIDTKYLSQKGVPSYNFALGGASIEASYIQLSNYINSNQTSVVILGLSPGVNLKTFVPPPLHPTIEYSYNIGDNFNIRSIPMIKFQWLAIEVVKKIFSKDHREVEVVMGQLRTKKTVPDRTNYPDQTIKKISSDDLIEAKYLVKLDSLCAANDIVFFAVSLPGYKKTQNDIPQGLHTLNYGDGNILNFINLNNRSFCTEIFDDETDWLGNSHLNQYGAEKLTEQLYREYAKYFGQ